MIVCELALISLRADSKVAPLDFYRSLDLARTLALNERWKAPSRFRRLEAVMTPFISTSKNSNAAFSSSSETRIPPLVFFGTFFGSARGNGTSESM